jgi:hypothetical protein
MIEILHADLVALVVMLEREHFGYNDRGAAALRAYRGLEAAAVGKVSAIAITPFASSGASSLDSPTNQQTNKPQRTEP